MKVLHARSRTSAWLKEPRAYAFANDGKRETTSSAPRRLQGPASGARRRRVRALCGTDLIFECNEMTTVTTAVGGHRLGDGVRRHTTHTPPPFLYII